MTTVDIVIVIVALGSAFMGWRKGIVLQLGGVAAIVAGIVAARMGGEWLTTYMEVNFDDGTPQGGYFYTVLARLILFIAGYAVVKMAARFLRGLTRALCLGFVDRLAGALFCFFEWMMVLSLVFNFWLIVKPKTNMHEMSKIGNGHAMEAIIDLAPAVLGWAMDSGAFTFPSLDEKPNDTGEC